MKTGRPKLPAHYRVTSFVLFQRHREWLDARAARMGVGRAEVIRRLIDREITEPTLGRVAYREGSGK